MAAGLLSAGEALAQELPDPVFAAQNVLRRPGTVDPLDVEPRPELEADRRPARQLHGEGNGRACRR